MTRVLRVTDSEPQAKLPASRRSARYLVCPPRTRTVWMRLAPSLVDADWRPSSYLRFLIVCGFLPPVARRLWRLSREIPRAAGSGTHAQAQAKGE